ncbi:CD209 antigen-like protein E [Betta splendens]|uniref:CD209 antigen-like protein E n=1 Tax=Betta splendens TaxID=158456 RepID=A0A6P7L8R2_BETSP|nr:CD209 antigen-like protein E [Betta splendens]
MPEADVVYADVKFTASKENKEPYSSPETTYEEVKITKTPTSGERSKVTQRALLLVLCALLLAAAVGLCLVCIDNLKNRKELDEIQERVKGFERKLQTSMNENEALRKNLTAKSCPTCEPDWDQHGESCYYFSSRRLTWDESRTACKRRGADLVQINSEEEQRFLENKVRGKMIIDEDKFWIGLTDSEAEGRWLWVDDSPLNESLSFWYGKEPDNWTGRNPAGEDCARMGIKEGATDLKCWFDTSCVKNENRICEKAAKTG